MEIRYLKHEDIQMDKWNYCIDNAVNRLPYAYSWYLDTVSHSWEALVAGDYNSVFPLTRRMKYGINYLFQPPFTQQLGLFSRDLITPEVVNEFLHAIPSKYKLVEINLNKYNIPDEQSFSVKQNVNLELPLISGYEDIRAKYSQNLKRNLKKADKSNLSIVPGVSPVEVIRMFQLNRGRNIKNLSRYDYIRLEQLIYKMARKGTAEIRGVYTERNNLCGAAIFVKCSDRIIFLFSGLNDEGRQVSAMPYLIDNVIRRYAGRNIALDFEGSNDENLAHFYKGFGAQVSYYTAIRINRLPWWIDKATQLVKKSR